MATPPAASVSIFTKADQIVSTSSDLDSNMKIDATEGKAEGENKNQEGEVIEDPVAAMQARLAALSKLNSP